VQSTDRLLVTSNVIVHETITLLRMRLGYESALQFGLRLLGETTTPIIRVTPADEEKAWAYLPAVSRQTIPLCGLHELLHHETARHQDGVRLRRGLS
jgi:hypothetical protein